jgi:hypothetical protein
MVEPQADVGRPDAGLAIDAITAPHRKDAA